MPQRESNYPTLARRLPALAVLVILGVFLSAFLGWIVPAFFGLTDEHAYLTSAKTLATRGTLARTAAGDSAVFLGENFIAARPLTPNPAAELYAKHPPAMAVLFAAAYAAGGPDAPFFVNVVCMLAAILGVYVLGRDLAHPAVGVIAAGALALQPLVMLYALHPMSHAADLAVTIWAMWAALRYHKRRKLPGLIVGGVLIGVAISIRHTNILLLLPALALLWIRPTGGQTQARRAPAIHGAVVLAIIALILLPTLVFNARVFGSPFRTGYTFTHESTAFSPGNLAAHAPCGVWSLFKPGFGLSLFLPAALVMEVFAFRRQRVGVLHLALWAIPMIVLYLAYYWMPENPWLYLRFFLPIYPAIILAAVAGAWWLLPAKPWARVILAAVSFAVAGGAWLHAGVRQEFQMHRAMSLLARQFAFGAEKLPPGCVLVATEGSHYYLDYATNLSVTDASMFAGELPESVRNAEADRGPLLIDSALAPVIRERAAPRGLPPGHAWLREQFAKGRRVVLLCGDLKLDAWRAKLAPEFAATPLTPLPLQWSYVEITPPQPATSPR